MFDQLDGEMCGDAQADDDTLDREILVFRAQGSGLGAAMPMPMYAPFGEGTKAASWKSTNEPIIESDDTVPYSTGSTRVTSRCRSAFRSHQTCGG